MTTADALPGDMPGLRAAALALIAERDELLRRVERMRQIIRQFQRAQFGRHSERLDPNQLQLALEEREIASAQTQAAAEKQATPRPRSEAGQRKSLPAHLPRIEVVIEPETTSCRCCGGAMHVIGEEKSERLDVIPVQHRILVTRRPKYACCACAGAVVQAPAAERLIRSGLPTEAMVAHVLVSKYAWHLPLYRQAQILLSQGIDIERSVLAFWVGYAAAELMPLWRRLREILLGSPRLFVDETRAPVLDRAAAAPRAAISGRSPATTAPGAVTPARRGSSIPTRRDAAPSMPPLCSPATAASCSATAMPPTSRSPAAVVPATP
jgi:transposase